MKSTLTVARSAMKVGAARPQQSRSFHIRGVAGLAVGFAVLATLTACGDKAQKTYDIAPIFPLSSDKCAKYDGDASGSGLTSHCYVTKDKCEQAAADWKSAMKNIPDAIEFTC